MRIQASEPHSPEFWSEVELWSRDKIAQFQLAALKTQLAYVYEHSAFYRARFDAVGFQPRDFRSFEDLRRLPVTRKSDYVSAIAAARPWGTQLACDPKAIARVHFSSGTTSSPAHNCWTRADIDRWSDLFARYFYGQGLRPGDLYQVLVGYAWFVGGMGITQAVERMGVATIPAGNQDSVRQIETMFAYGTTAFFVTPSFATHLGETALEMGRDLRQSRVRMIGVGGEPGGSLKGTRKRIEEMWGVRPLDCYGMIEFQPTAWEFPGADGLVLAEDFLFAEILHPETLDPVPDGDEGILVLTHLDKQACPLVRWWTGDVVVRDSKPRANGRTHACLVGGVRGRADDMLIVRGVNLFPSAVEDVLRQIPSVGDEFLIIIDNSLKDAAGFLTGIKLKVEPARGAAADLRDVVANAIREKLTVRANVDIVPAGSLPRAVHKAKRLVREDN